jgi:hypothetical protein
LLSIPSRLFDLQMNDETAKLGATPPSLTVVIAERTFSLYRADGREVRVIARLGQPYQEESNGDWRCPLQVLGVGNDRIYAPWGEDAFVALQWAIDYIGQLLDAAVTRLELRNGLDRTSTTENRWIWRYPPEVRSGRN